MREGLNHLTYAAFYRVVVLVVLLFGSDTWVLSTVMEKQLSGVHTSFMPKVMGKRSKRRSERTWRQEGAESVIKAAGTQDLRTCIDRIKATVAQLVVLRTIL